ncbi:MAG: hypothetical protein ACQCN6_12295 [Candidatus Bathyarchaeia archaeon]
MVDREKIKNTASSNVTPITSGGGLNTIPPITEQTNIIDREKKDRKKIFVLAIDLAEIGDENKNHILVPSKVVSKVPKKGSIISPGTNVIMANKNE